MAETNHKTKDVIGPWLAAIVSLIVVATPVHSAVIANRHNLSVAGPGPVQATAGSQEVCVFCHTPHAPRGAVDRALWNRDLSSATYTRYNSSSLDATKPAMTDGGDGLPGGGSKLCLSCHDGTIALGSIANSPRSGVGSGYTMTDGSGPTTNMPHGPTPGVSYPDSGFTRNLGSDLRNDHPISVTYNDTLALTDGELRRLDTSQRDVETGGTIIGLRSPGYKPLLPLSPTSAGGQGQVQCTTCHDPHESQAKFLRLPHLQKAAPVAGFSASNQICLNCHEKLGAAWIQSAHANPVVADEPYINIAADKNRRGFYKSGEPIPKVWEVACLNCHDTHTVRGSRRLLREGVTTAAVGADAASFRQGSSATQNTVSAIENTCYQCHQGGTTKIIGTATGTVPDIKSEFEKTYRMPITTTDQGGVEVHDITDADFTETRENLGYNNVNNRHVECTDCHNPHRMRRRSTFYGLSAAVGEGAKRTHNVGGTAANQGADGNVASGPLRGAWGVEPTFGTMAAWPQNPVSYDVKKGDPASPSTARSESHLTREYQLCFKCHSDYANSTDPTLFPAMGNKQGGTANLYNGVTRYTNVAAEFGSVNATDPPSSCTDQGEYGNDPYFTPCGSPPADSGGQPSDSSTPNGSDDAYGVQNHRSWHPVMWPTGRTRMERNNSTTAGSFRNIRAPFDTDANIGYQTMYCSDCHGSNESWTQGVGPNTAAAQGPHGSSKPFLLKGNWDSTSQAKDASPTASTPKQVGATNTSGSICGRCHDPMPVVTEYSTSNAYGGFNSGAAGHDSGFSKYRARCTTCHIALPHGWKNKAFLVNLNCIGSEISGYAAGCTARPEKTFLTAQPYYNNAYLAIRTWRKSTGWGDQNSCGSASYSGKTWMSSPCSSTAAGW